MNPLPTARLFGGKVDAWWYKNNGFDVEFWDLAPLFWPKENLDQYYGGCDNYRYIGPSHQVFTKAENVLSAMRGLTKNMVVWNLRGFYGKKDVWIFDELQRKGIPYYLQRFDTSIELHNPYKWLIEFLRIGKQSFFNRRMKPKGVIGSGRRGRSYALRFFPNARFISIPSVKVLWQNSEPVPEVEVPYNLFVDENIDYAPDAKLLGYDVCLDPDSYYCRLNQLFDDIEDWSGRPVVIAASGKFQYQRDRFNGRRLIYGRTLPLIQNSSYVIGHMSLALDQCLVSKKPFLRIDAPEFTKKKREGFPYSLLSLICQPILMTKVTKAVYLQSLSLNADMMKEIIFDYLREDGATEDYHLILAEEFLGQKN